MIIPYQIMESVFISRSTDNKFTWA